MYAVQNWTKVPSCFKTDYEFCIMHFPWIGIIVCNVSKFHFHEGKFYHLQDLIILTATLWVTGGIHLKLLGRKICSKRKSLCKKLHSLFRDICYCKVVRKKYPHFFPRSQSTYSSFICIKLVRRSSLWQLKRALASFPTVAPLEPSLIPHLSSIW